MQQFLGHKDIRNTMVYINIERTLFGASDDDEFTVRVAETPAASRLATCTALLD